MVQPLIFAWSLLKAAIMSKLNQWCVPLLCDSHVINILSWEPSGRWIDRSKTRCETNFSIKWHSTRLILRSNDQLRDRDRDCPISIPYQSLPVCLYGCTWLMFPLDYGDMISYEAHTGNQNPSTAGAWARFMYDILCSKYSWAIRTLQFAIRSILKSTPINHT